MSLCGCGCGWIVFAAHSCCLPAMQRTGRRDSGLPSHTQGGGDYGYAAKGMRQCMRACILCHNFFITLACRGARRYCHRAVAAHSEMSQMLYPGMQVFHQGFNLGSNIAEAVNWSLPAWLPVACSAMARDCALSIPGQVPIEKVCYVSHDQGGLH